MNTKVMTLETINLESKCFNDIRNNKTFNPNAVMTVETIKP